jgi:aryl-alcohol dehydrogenase-like predicted oxidoreductase
MEQRILGRTGVSVSKLCLGAMMFGASGEPDHEESIRIIDAAIDAGINFIDTADVYSAGESEEIVGKALAAEVALSDEVLDRIDQINPPGVTINHLGNGWTQPALRPSARRR